MLEQGNNCICRCCVCHSHLRPKHKSSRPFAALTTLNYNAMMLNRIGARPPCRALGGRRPESCVFASLQRTPSQQQTLLGRRQALSSGLLIAGTSSSLAASALNPLYATAAYMEEAVQLQDAASPSATPPNYPVTHVTAKGRIVAGKCLASG